MTMTTTTTTTMLLHRHRPGHSISMVLFFAAFSLIALASYVPLSLGGGGSTIKVRRHSEIPVSQQLQKTFIPQRAPVNMPPDQHRWVFFHMPKTGGMTMRGLLQRSAKASHQQVAFLQKNYNEARCAPGCQGILGVQSLEQLTSDFGGHSASLFTMLRDPIDRSYSAYHYVLRETNKPIHRLYTQHSLEELLRKQLFYNDIGLGRNAYTRVLSDFFINTLDHQHCRGLRQHAAQGRWSDRLEGPMYWTCLLRLAKRVLKHHMDLVCVTERYQQCVSLLHAELFPDWIAASAAISHRNAAPKKHIRSKAVDALLRIANKEDIELYGFAQDLFQQRWKTHNQSAPQHLWAWGTNSHGQAGLAPRKTDGLGSAVEVLPPLGMEAWPSLVQLGGGGGVWDWNAKNMQMCGGFSLALAANGILYAAGWNRWHLLGRGIGTDRHRFAPVMVPLQSAIRSFDAGHRHVLALTYDGHVLAWGMNQYGQLGDKAKSSAKRHSYGVPFVVAGFVGEADGADPVIQVAAGGRHSLALTEVTGSVWIWGLNDHAMLGLEHLSQMHVNQPTFMQRLHREAGPIRQICAGTRHSVALSRHGDIWEWGWDLCSSQKMRLCKRFYFQNTVLPPGAGLPMQLSCNGGATFVVDSRGHVYSWGTNAVAELGLGAPWMVGENVKTPHQVLGLPLIQGVWPSYDYTPGFHGGTTLALSLDGASLWAWGPLGSLASGVVDRSGAHAMPAQAKTRCSPAHHDGHMGNQKARCLALWASIAIRPVQLSVPFGSMEWTTAGMVNRGTVLFASRKQQ